MFLINTSLLTVDHAGPMPPHQHFLIGSRFQERLPGQISISLLNPSFPVKTQIWAAMVVKHTMLSLGWQTMKSQIEPALSIKLVDMTMVNSAHRWNFAETVNQVKPVSFQMNIMSMELMSSVMSVERRI